MSVIAIGRRLLERGPIGWLVDLPALRAAELRAGVDVEVMNDEGDWEG